MNNLIIQMTSVILLGYITGCSGVKPSPEADPAITAEALMAESDNKVAKLYIVTEDSDTAALTNMIFKVNDVLAGEIGEEQYLYLKFDEGFYKISSKMHYPLKDNISDEGEISYLAKPGSVDIISCPMSHFFSGHLPDPRI